MCKYRLGKRGLLASKQRCKKCNLFPRQGILGVNLQGQFWQWVSVRRTKYKDLFVYFRTGLLSSDLKFEVFQFLTQWQGLRKHFFNFTRQKALRMRAVRWFCNSCVVNFTISAREQLLFCFSNGIMRWPQMGWTLPQNPSILGILGKFRASSRISNKVLLVLTMFGCTAWVCNDESTGQSLRLRLESFTFGEIIVHCGFTFPAFFCWCLKNNLQILHIGHCNTVQELDCLMCSVFLWYWYGKGNREIRS